jgi:hypothetical protein
VRMRPRHRYPAGRRVISPGGGAVLPAVLYLSVPAGDHFGYDTLEGDWQLLLTGQTDTAASWSTAGGEPKWEITDWTFGTRLPLRGTLASLETVDFSTPDPISSVGATVLVGFDVASVATWNEPTTLTLTRSP